MSPLYTHNPSIRQCPRRQWQGIAVRVHHGRLAVDGGVERGIVVHLQLAIEFEAACASESIAPQCIQAVGEIATLFLENGEPVAIALRVAGRRILPFGFLPGVIDL